MLFYKNARPLRTGPQDDVKHLVSTLLALIPMTVLFLIVPSVSNYLDQTEMSVTVRMMILSALFVVVTAVPCYFISKRHPGSALYAPAVAVLTSYWILSGHLPDYWTKNGKLWLLGAAMIIAMVMGILGSLKGDKESEEGVNGEQ